MANGCKKMPKYKPHDYNVEGKGYRNIRTYEKDLADYTIVENITIIFERPSVVSANHVAAAASLIERVLDIHEANVY